MKQVFMYSADFIVTRDSSIISGHLPLSTDTVWITIIHPSMP